MEGRNIAQNLGGLACREQEQRQADHQIGSEGGFQLPFSVRSSVFGVAGVVSFGVVPLVFVFVFVFEEANV